MTLSQQPMRPFHYFSKVAYYKVNAYKSSILGIAINKSTSLAIQKDLPYLWSPNSILYLGIQLTSPVSNLFQTNYYPLINEFQKEISRIQKHYISWKGRLVAYKMLLLPKLTYLFRALPILLPSSFFNSMHNKLASFMWAGKRARIS